MSYSRFYSRNKVPNIFSCQTNPEIAARIYVTFQDFSKDVMEHDSEEPDKVIETREGTQKSEMK